MSDDKRQDDPAMHGMLMEYHRLSADVDEDLVHSVMSGVHSMEARPRKLIKRFVWMGAAATVALLAVASIFLLRPPKPLGIVASSKATVQRHGETLVLKKGAEVFASDIVTDRAKLTLTDTSVVKTDDLTTLRFIEPAKGERAHMELAKGRAFFKVSKAPGRFMVKTDALVEVKGTIFGVDYHPDAASTFVSVLEGIVQVSNDAGAIDVHRGESSKAQPDQTPSSTELNPYDSMIWARDPIHFDNHPIPDVLTWIEAHSQITFEYDRAALSKIAITISVTDEPISQVIDQVLITGGLDTQRDGNVIRVKPW